MRPQITCGTHALALALSANLRPGDELLSPVGKPYDTLEEVIGIRQSKGSLAEYGVTYKPVSYTHLDVYKRQVVRIVTPGTNLDTQALDETKNNYIMCIVYIADRYGVSVADISTGDYFVTVSYTHLSDAVDVHKTVVSP